MTSEEPFIYWSKRVGKNSNIFLMPKIRTMKMATPQLATNKIENVKNYMLPLGNFLRKTSLDEIPQFLSVLKGEMSIVGPRPALFNQYDLIDQRKNYKLDLLKPGITGLAQISGRDNLSIVKKVELDREYAKHQSFFFDLKIISFTVIKVLKIKNIRH